MTSRHTAQCRATAHRIAKAAELEARMVEDDICAGILLRCKKKGPPMPKPEPVKKRVNWALFDAPGYVKARQEHEALPADRRAFLEGEWK